MPFFFFFNDTATPEIYPLSLHDALPISLVCDDPPARPPACSGKLYAAKAPGDRKSTRLNSSHVRISYAVFCLKKTIALDLDPHRSTTSLPENECRRYGKRNGGT